MLIGTRQLIEQGCLAAVLVTHQSKGHAAALRQGGAVLRAVELAFLAQTGMLFFLTGTFIFLCLSIFSNRYDTDLLRIRQTNRQFISMKPQFHGVTHGGQFHNGNFRAGNHTHIQKMLAQRTVSANLCDHRRFTDCQIF